MLETLIKKDEELIKLRKINNRFFWGDRILGEIHKDRFVTHRKEGHYYRKQKSFNFNAELIDNYLIPLKINKIVLFYHKKDGGETCYTTTPKTIKNMGSLIQENIFDPQYAMPLDYFEK